MYLGDKPYRCSINCSYNQSVVVLFMFHRYGNFRHLVALRHSYKEGKEVSKGNFLRLQVKLSLISGIWY